MNHTGGTTHPDDAGELARLIGAGRFAELETLTRGMLDRNPDSGIAWKALGVALLLQGKEALLALERAAVLLPEDGEAHSNLANELLRGGRCAESVTWYARASALLPLSAEVCNNWGNALRGLGQHEEAVAKYLQALRLKPDFAEASNNLGNALRGLGRLEDAVASYQRALTLNPHYAEAFNNLGNALFELRRFDLAAANYTRALDIKPNFAAAHSNLGNTLRSLGRPEQAEASYRRALSLDGSFSGAHSNLGDVLRDLGRYEEAAASCRRAIELEPERAGGHNSLGNALMELGRLNDAVASYRRALALMPRFAEAHVNLGLALRQLGHGSEARQSCQAALEANPKTASAWVLLGELDADAGRFDEAEESFRRAAAIDPRSAEACAGVAASRRMTTQDAEWWNRAQSLAQAGLAPRQESHLRFAMGKYCDDVRDFEHAFANFQRAHELRRRYGPVHDRQGWTRHVDRLIEGHGRDWIDRWRTEASSPLPVFIVGMPRSGTSLAEQILASHPAVFGAGELPFWTGRNWPASTGDGLDADSCALPLADWAADYLRRLEAMAPEALRIVDKMPANFLCLGLIHAALPKARFIHMLRDPIDTCLSVYFQHFRTGHTYADDLEDLAHYYREYLRVMRHWRSAIPPEEILDVPYEALVDDQEAWSRKMLQFVGLPWDERCLDFHRTRRGVMTASKWQVRQKMNRGSVGRWRNYEKFLGPLAGLTQHSDQASAT
jgi:tetratricopeptide (TPR) repeat protein